MAAFSRWCAVLLSTWMVGLSVAGAQAPAAPTPAAPSAAEEDAQNAQLSDEDRKKKASEHFERGVMLFGDGAYRAALIEFERAYATAPDYRLLYNLAHVRMLLEDYLGATRDYERYLKDGQGKIPHERVEAVQRELTILRERVGRVVITANRTGAKVFVDEAQVGVTPLDEPMLVNVGRHRIYAEAPDGASATKIVDVAAGEQLAVQLELRAAPRAVVQVKDESGAPVWPISFTIATGALAVGTLAVGLTALSAENELTDLTRKIPANKRAIENQRDKALKLSIVTDVLGGTTLLAAVVSAWLWVRETRGSDEPDTASTTTSAWRPQLGWASVGVERKF
jgi:tetratricopeptide (TPR) repeat protein